ncbi:MAG: GlsB/YeaQ/YmgE family stress response membrane protein [Propionicimonas sp.]|nr:GlsB/YeaQ/YmgE family stress response membrane protein [Propionicimonas sp.]
MLILAIILFGMLVGAAAQLILHRSGKGVDWAKAFVSGLAGSFVGGLLSSLIAGDGLELRPSGLIGSLVGALIVTAAWEWWQRRAKKA